MTTSPPARVLVLGGTRWLGHEIAAQHVAQGAEVTCLARGASGEVATGAKLVTADRDAPDGYAALDGDWDEVIDVTMVPAHADAAANALADRARHWTFVSSVSAQRLEAPDGADEDDDLIAEDATGQEYGGAKAWIERVLAERLGDRLQIVRPGLIGGPGDLSDRFGYWVARAAVAGREPLLVPNRDQSVQVIDVRDLVEYLVGRSTHQVGVVNAVGQVTTLARVIDISRRLANHTGELVSASDDELAAEDIDHWAGPRALPLTLPAGLDTHARRSPARYLAQGGRHRDLEAMLADVLVDERARGIDRERATGLSRQDELAVISKLQRR